MKRSEGIAYLTQCADRNGDHWYEGRKYTQADCPTCDGSNRAGHLWCGSRYGVDSADCSEVAWRLAYIVARETGEPITLDALDHAMSMVVNDHDDVAYTVRTYGHRMYR